MGGVRVVNLCFCPGLILFFNFLPEDKQAALTIAVHALAERVKPGSQDMQVLARVVIAHFLQFGVTEVAQIEPVYSQTF